MMMIEKMLSTLLFLSIHKAFKFSMYSDLLLLLLLLPFFFFCISKFPFYIQRHYRKAFNSSHNVLCIWILKEEMETFFAAAFKKLFQALKKKREKKSFLLLSFWKYSTFCFLHPHLLTEVHWRPFHRSTKLFKTIIDVFPTLIQLCFELVKACVFKILF